MLISNQLFAQSESKKQKMNNVKSSSEVVKDFFAAFGKGDMEGLINSFQDNCKITAVRESARTGKEIYGSYEGKQGVSDFISNLGAAFNTKAFTVNNVIGEGKVAFANGKFTHEIKSTGKMFSSDWALMCVVENGKILEYHFYEDSASFINANKK
jgi:ketosteroid isomerase-like protein